MMREKIYFFTIFDKEIFLVFGLSSVCSFVNKKTHSIFLFIFIFLFLRNFEKTQDLFKNFLENLEKLDFILI